MCVWWKAHLFKVCFCGASLLEMPRFMLAPEAKEDLLVHLMNLPSRHQSCLQQLKLLLPPAAF